MHLPLVICAVLLVTFIGVRVVLNLRAIQRQKQLVGSEDEPRLLSPRPEDKGAVQKRQSAPAQHLQRFSGEPLDPGKARPFDDLVEDDEHAEPWGFNVERCARDAEAYFNANDYASFYRFDWDGVQVNMEVCFIAYPPDSASEHRGFMDMHLRVEPPSQQGAAVEVLARAFGVTLAEQLPVKYEADEQGKVIAKLRGDYCGAVKHPRYGKLELYRFVLGEGVFAECWLGISADEQRGWIWPAREARARYASALHLSALVRGGQPYTHHEHGIVQGLESDALVHQLMPLSLGGAEPELVTLQGERLCVVTRRDSLLKPGGAVLMLDHLSDAMPRLVAQVEGVISAVGMDEDGRLIALRRFETADFEGEEHLDVLDAQSGRVLWSKSLGDESGGGEVSLSPSGDRVVIDVDAHESLDEGGRKLLVFDARTGASAGASAPMLFDEMGGWFESGVWCSYWQGEDEDELRPDTLFMVWEPWGSWRPLPPYALALPKGDGVVQQEGLGLRLPSGERWPYTTFDDLSMFWDLDGVASYGPRFSGASLLLWDGPKPLLLEVTTGRCWPLFNEAINQEGVFIEAVGRGCIIVTRSSDALELNDDDDDDREVAAETYLWATFTVPASRHLRPLHDGVAW